MSAQRDADMAALDEREGPAERVVVSEWTRPTSEPADKWAALMEEARAFEAWYGPGRMGVNAWVGVDTVQGFYGGWSADGDHIDDYDWDESTMSDACGKTPEEVIDDLIGIARRYRQHVDEQRAEWAAEDGAS